MLNTSRQMSFLNVLFSDVLQFVVDKKSFSPGTVRLLYKPNLSRAALLKKKKKNPAWFSTVLVTSLPCYTYMDIRFVWGFLNTARIRDKNWNQV